ncbi:hypothetical protein VKT23_000929 [Stygiomarasmius scandens]|uniref:F-box domain-containing protein n=1 Tax=Marasmiellus scandens TaxID=2682957 RepID=A0ABR1K6N7_9AGAR
MAFPAVPTEILREILEFAVASSRPTTLSLTLVNSNVRLWTLPLLYHSVTLRSASTLKHFLNAFLISASQSRRLASNIPLARRVKHLCIMSPGPMQSIQGVLTRCTNIQSLACGFNLASYTQLGFKLPSRVTVRHASPRSTRESHLIGMACRDGIPFGILPPDTSHLHIQPLSRQVLLSLTKLHLHLPNITHLAISLPSRVLSTRVIPSSLLGEILALNVNLKILLVQLTDTLDDANVLPDIKSCMSDPRVVFRSIGTTSVANQWESSVKYGPNIWADAEQTITNRQYPTITASPMTLVLPSGRNFVGRRVGMKEA